MDVAEHVDVLHAEAPRLMRQRRYTEAEEMIRPGGSADGKQGMRRAARPVG